MMASIELTSADLEPANSWVVVCCAIAGSPMDIRQAARAPNTRRPAMAVSSSAKVEGVRGRSIRFATLTSDLSPPKLSLRLLNTRLSRVRRPMPSTLAWIGALPPLYAECVMIKHLRVLAVALIVPLAASAQATKEIPLPPSQNPTNAALPIAAAVWAGNTLYVSGWLDPDMKADTDTKSQTVGILKDMQKLLESQGL